MHSIYQFAAPLPAEDSGLPANLEQLTTCFKTSLESCDSHHVALVCGSDGRTYLSESCLKFVVCVLDDKTLKVDKQGPCDP